MVKFRQKEYTIQEGHYTGPKDIDKVPGALEVIGKAAGTGGVIGAAVGTILKDSTMIDGALTGGKWGALGGILLKLFINYLHNPMTRVKYQEVDKNIRRQFGIYQMSGITVGDSIDKRATVDERFGFNDRNVTDYKLNFAVHNDTVTMYTFGMTVKELEQTSAVLDYYTKKYFGMDYSSTLINQKLNSYAVNITFTNYQVISNFIIELSEKLKTRINLLDNKVIVSSRIEEKSKEEEEKTFSTSQFNKFDLIKILGKTGSFMSSNILKSNGWKQAIGYTVLAMIKASVDKIGNDELAKSGLKAPRESFGNPYLEETLKKLYYIEGFNYTIGDKQATNNMSMINGLFIVTTSKGSDDAKLIDDNYWKANKGGINRSDTGKAIVYTYPIKSRSEFELLLNKLMSTKLTFNIFEK